MKCEITLSFYQAVYQDKNLNILRTTKSQGMIDKTTFILVLTKVRVKNETLVFKF